MRLRIRSVMFVALAIGLAMGAAAPTARAVENGTQAFKCELDLWKSFKIANFVEKFVGKCLIDYEKRNLFLGGEKGKALPDAILKSADLCDTFVGGKALAVVAPVSNGCGDDDLVALGHLPSTVADTGALIAMEALNDGLKRTVTVNNDLWEILDTMEGLGCTACGTLRNAAALNPTGNGPCASYVCGLSVGSAVSLQGLPVPISGTLNVDVCEFASLGGTDLGVFGGPARTVKAAITGLADVCITGGGTRGAISNGGTLLSRVVDLEICQDHVVGNGACSVTTTTVCATAADCPATETCSGNTESNECLTTGPDSNPTGFTPVQCQDNLSAEGGCSTTTSVRCSSDSDCPTTETCGGYVIPGGACSRLAGLTPPGPGDAVIQTVLQTEIVTAADAGPDTIPCTADDTSTPTAPVAGAATTAGADGVIHDALAGNVPVNGNSLQMADISGTPFNVTGVDSLESGDLVGTLATAFPVLSVEVIPGISVIDANTSVLLNCTIP